MNDANIRVRFHVSDAPMITPFKPLKAAQAAGVILAASNKSSISRLRLLKLLYIADRESLAERARPVTGDAVAAMEHGPVLSHIYDFIKVADKKLHPGSPANVWQAYFTNEGRDVVLTAAPGNGELSRYEERKLREVTQRFLKKSDGYVRDYTHKFPEYINNKPEGNTSIPIPVDELLDNVGLGEEKEAILANARAEEAAQRLLSKT